MGEHLIVRIIQKYHPDWEPPRDTGRAWISCLCPFHGDENKSASVSFSKNAFRCFACPVKGDAIAIIREQEEVSFAEAKRIAAELSTGSDGAIQAEPARKSSRKVFGDQGSQDGVRERPGRDRQVRSGVRGRPAPWT